MACRQKRMGDRAVGQAGVEMVQAEFPGQATPQCALARSGGAINGDDKTVSHQNIPALRVTVL